VGFIDEHRGRFGGVKPICRMLTAHGGGIGPSIYCEARNRPPFARALRDTVLKGLIVRLHADDYGVYGARKVWRELGRQGRVVARCTVQRLMRVLDLRGAVRGGKVRATIADPTAARAPDLAKRAFVASGPHRVWVADFADVPAYTGVVYVAFVLDTVSRRIAGWSAATAARTAARAFRAALAAGRVVKVIRAGRSRHVGPCWSASAATSSLNVALLGAVNAPRSAFTAPAGRQSLSGTRASVQFLSQGPGFNTDALLMHRRRPRHRASSPADSPLRAIRHCRPDTATLRIPGFCFLISADADPRTPTRS
jgi:putative transposase